MHIIMSQTQHASAETEHSQKETQMFRHTHIPAKYLRATKALMSEELGVKTMVPPTDDILEQERVASKQYEDSSL